MQALASTGQTVDGLPMEPLTWDGVIQTLGSYDGVDFTLCAAGGPPELLPMTQRIGCVLWGDRHLNLAGAVGCGAYTMMRFEDDRLFWIARVNVASNQVSIYEPDSGSWRLANRYTACWDDPYTPVAAIEACL